MLRASTSKVLADSLSKTRARLSYLVRHNRRQTLERTGSKVSSALNRALVWPSDEADRKWFEKIESRRHTLNAVANRVEYTDYGAGSGDATRSGEQMQTGMHHLTTLGSLSRNGSKSPLWCRILYTLVREVQPTSLLELGSCVGISGAYQAAACTTNGKGRLVTLEGSRALVEAARETFEVLGLDNAKVIEGRFADTLEDAATQSAPIDFVFIDGHHDEQATLTYFETICQYLAPKSVVVFDNIAWSNGMKRAWSAISTDQRVAVAVDLGKIGICDVDMQLEAGATGVVLRIPLG